jgi:2-hydroxychromene-2-carboxylate isomerase
VNDEDGPATDRGLAGFCVPHAYFAMLQLERLAVASGCKLILRPVILWAVLRRKTFQRPRRQRQNGPISCVT